jgi:hypothetical protein
MFYFVTKKSKNKKKDFFFVLLSNAIAATAISGTSFAVSPNCFVL